MKDFLKFLPFIFLILIMFSFMFVDIQKSSFDYNETLSSKEFNFGSKKVITELERNLSKDIQVVFCPSHDCFDLFYANIEKANESVYCVLYDLDNQNLSNLFLTKSNEVVVELIVDNRYLERESITNLFNSNIKIYSDVERGTKYDNYVHDKFCVIDEKTIFTGSMNPTDRGFFQNDNVILLLESEELSKNYLNEFNQLAAGYYAYHKSSTLEYNDFIFKYENETYLVENYFCPQDNCEDVTLDLLNSAKKEILFAAYVITQDDIEELLVEKSKNINVRGIVEEKFIDVQGSRVDYLMQHFDIYLSRQSHNMHHKFFVVDEDVVLMGSMNPSNSGFRYNDENILVIRNEKIAKLFKEEFLRIYSNKSG